MPEPLQGKIISEAIQNTIEGTINVLNARTALLRQTPPPREKPAFPPARCENN